MKNRIIYFDTARSVAMLWIVAVWHLSASIDGWETITSPCASIMTICCLATFSYISGFFLSKEIRTKKDVILFYKGRLKRFYPLYFLACLSMLIGHLISGSENLMNTKQFILSLVGASSLLGPAPTTLWYFSMLIFFYLLTPIVNFQKKIVNKLAIIISAYLLIIVCVLLTDGEPRVLSYYPVYFAALLVGPKKNEFNMTRRRVELCAFADYVAFFVFCVLYSKYSSGVLGIIIRTGVAATSVKCFITLSRILSKIIPERIIAFLSYISMCAYLFHGQVFLLYEYLFGKMSLVTAYLFVVPTVFLLSWAIQRLYDILQKKILCH